MLTLTGCETNSARSIIGHTYGVVESPTSYLSIYFSKSGNANINFVNGSEKLITSHFTYEIIGDDVEILIANFDKAEKLLFEEDTEDEE